MAVLSKKEKDLLDGLVADPTHITSGDGCCVRITRGLSEDDYFWDVRVFEFAVSDFGCGVLELSDFDLDIFKVVSKKAIGQIYKAESEIFGSTKDKRPLIAMHLSKHKNIFTEAGFSIISEYVNPNSGNKVCLFFYDPNKK